MDAYQITMTRTINTLTSANTLREQVRERIIEKQHVVPILVELCWQTAESARKQAERHGPDGLPWEDRLLIARLAEATYRGALDALNAEDARVVRASAEQQPKEYISTRWPEGSAGD